MKQNLFKTIMAFALFVLPIVSYGQTITLGASSKFVLLTTTGAITNSGTNFLTHLTGKVGSNSGSSTGFGNVDGGMHDGDVVSNAASSDLLIAYSQLDLATPTVSHSSSLGGGETILPGVISIGTAATLNSELILDGNASSVFIFKINGALSVGSGAKVKLINGALACNVFWKTEGMVSIGSNSTLRGTIVAHNAAIAFGTGDSLEGRALAINGAITMNSLTAFTPIGCGSPVLTGPVAPTLGAVGTFALFSSIGPVSNGGAISYITGDVGTNLGLTTNYDPLYVNGIIHPTPDGATALAATALSVAYGQLNALTTDINLLYPAIFGHNLVLTPHTYLLNAATSLTDTLILNAQGNPNAVFVLKVNGALNTITGAVVKLVNGAQSKNVYWKVEGAVSLANNTTFHGTIVANNGAIDITTGAKFFGRALTTNGAITTNGDTINALVTPSPATISGDSTVCAGSSIPLMASDTGGVWSATNPRATVSGTGMVTGVMAGIDTILYTVTNRFGTAVSSKVITVRPNANAGIINGPSSVCIGSTINLTDTATGGVWSASNANATVLGGIVTGISSGLDTIRYTVTNSCGTAVATKVVTIQPTPTVNTVANQVVCNGASTAPVTFGGTVPGTTYTWTNDNTSIGLPASGSGNIASFIATNSSSNAVIANITVTPSANSCTGMAQSFTITVRPTPTVNTVANQVICNGALSAAVAFSGAVAGTSYSWTNDNSTIGLPTSGTGTIPVFTATNSTSATTLANIVITPSASGCTGSTRNFTYTIHPIPNSGAVANQVLCNGAVTAPINFAGTVSGTTYSWTNDNTTIGLPASGTGNIAGFTASNISGATTVANIMMTPSANGCMGTTRNFSITVHPTPTVNTVANQTLCNGAFSAPVMLSGAASGTAYNWTNDNATIGLPINGIGNIPVFTASNMTSATTIANIVITPSANGCTGSTKSFSYTVHPTPSVNTIANQVVCNGTATAPVNFSGVVSATTYNWTNSNNTMGLASTGSGNIPSFTAINTTNVPATTTIVVSPTANACSGASRSFTITVNPTPIIAAIANQAVCNGLPTAMTNFNSSVCGSTYSWTNNNNSIGLGLSGTGNIPSFVANNNTEVSVVATITVTPTANSCQGSSAMYTYTIHPTPVAPRMTLTTPPSVCHMTYFRNFGAATLPPAGIQYSWSAVNAQISDTGNTQQYSLVNFKTVGTATVILTATVNATGCKNRDSYNVTVTNNMADVPAQVIYFNKSFVALQNNEEAYAWGYDNAKTLAPTYLPTEMNQDYVNANPQLDSNNYWVMVTHDNCIQKTYYNKPSGALMKIAKNEVVIFPNPAGQQIKVDITTTVSGTVQMEIYSMMGQKMYVTNDLVSNPIVDVSLFPSGIYVVVCYRDNEKISTTRFMKN